MHWKKGKRNWCIEVIEGLWEKKWEHNVDFPTNYIAILDFSKYLWDFRERFFFSSAIANMSVREIGLYQARAAQPL